MNETYIVILVFFGIALMAFIFSSLKVVPRETAWITETFGKYRRTLNPGVNVVIPFFEHVAYRHSLREIFLETSKLNCLTQDNITLSVNGVFSLKITDPVKASYNGPDLVSAMVQLAQTSLKSEIMNRDLIYALKDRNDIGNAVLTSLNRAAGPWGIKMLRFDIKEFTPPPDIVAALEAQQRAEREHRARILEKEAGK